MRIYLLRVILCLTIVIFSVSSLMAQGNYYSYRASDTVHYNLGREFIAVQLDTAWATDSLFQIWDRPEWDSIPIEPSEFLFGKNFISFSIQYPADSTLDTNAFILRIMDSVRLRQDVMAVNPYLVSDNRFPLLIGRTFFVDLRKDSVTEEYDSTDVLAYSSLRDSTKTTIVEEHFAGTTFDLLTITDSSTQTTLEIANRFYESGYFTSAAPNFIHSPIPCSTPDDTHYGDQWGIQDAEVDKAWDVTTGCSNIKIAVIDDGVDREHEDLADNLLDGYDTFATKGAIDDQLHSSNGDISRGTYTHPSNDPVFAGAYKNDRHGTTVAGVIGAIGYNTTGIAGVAYTSKIVPIRFRACLQIFSGLVPQYRPISDSYIADAFYRAFESARADIINYSWVGTQSDIVWKTIDKATKNGRNGLGCIVVAARGNGDETHDGSEQVEFPAMMPNVISVAATDNTGHRWVKSHYGAEGDYELDVSAPGTNMYTTDVTGTVGYAAGPYQTNGQGTSLSAGFVSGVMALILSVQPTLTWEEAKDILESTCDKVGGYSDYHDHPNGQWSRYLGYGRVNANAAVEKASTMYIDHKNWNGHKNFFAKKMIIAGDGVSSYTPHGEVNVLYNAAADVTFRAGKEIALLPGFSAIGNSSPTTSYPGATFSAFIDDDCVLDIWSNSYGSSKISSSSAKAGLSPAAYIPPATQESSLSLSPNPVSGLLRIRFAVAATSPVHIDIVNLYGQRIATVVDGEQSQGNHNFKFDVSDLTNGMYFVQLRTPTGTVTKPIIVTH